MVYKVMYIDTGLEQTPWNQRSPRSLAPPSILSEMSPVVLSLISALFYSFWALLSKQASGTLNRNELQILVLCGNLVLSGLVVFSDTATEFRVLSMPREGGISALGAGLFAALGGLACAQAIVSGGDASVVSSLSGLYPAITFVLGVMFMGEQVSTNKVLGVVFALASAFAFSR